MLKLQITDINEEDIVFVRFDTEVIAQSCLPYFIALDRSTKSVGACFFSFSPSTFLALSNLHCSASLRMVFSMNNVMQPVELSMFAVANLKIADDDEQD